MNKKKLILVLVGNILLGSVAYFAYYFQKGDVPTVKEMAETRAYQWAQWLVENKYEIKYYKSPQEKTPDSTSHEVERGLASDDLTTETRKTLDGEIGRDPWGKPYYFHVEGDGGSGSTIHIWSVGENSSAEYKNSKELITNGETGDDILVRYPVK